LEISPHAAVAANVELARKVIGERSTGIVNAISRKIVKRSWSEWLETLTADLSAADALALKTAHPRWIVDAYAQVLPSEELEAALSANNSPAIPTLVVRPGLLSREELLEESGGEPTEFSPWGVSKSGDPGKLASIRSGNAGVQDEGSQLCVLAAYRAWQAKQEQTESLRENAWLDMCAGPGGKSALLCGLAIENDAELFCNELLEHRARLVEQALRAYPASSYRVTNLDATDLGWQPASFNLVLCDAPCSGLGALRRHPDSRWTRQSEQLAELTQLQRKLFQSAASLVSADGVLAWVTCSPSEQETAEIVLAGADKFGLEILDTPSFLPEVPNANASTDGRFIQLWPHKHGTDAMFVALLTPKAK
jgi:16S rRNA (cytosine967-C5)-methyltransferase